MNKEFDKEPFEDMSSAALCYIKRPDLRPNEPSSPYNETYETGGEFEPLFRDWNYWIDSIGLFDEQTRIEGGEVPPWHAMSIPTAPFIEEDGQIDPTQILRYFCSCHEMKVYPPAWIMDELYQRVDKYLRDNERGEGRCLGEYFGEKTESSPKPKFREYVMKKAMEIYCANVHRLITWFGLTQTAALDIIEMQLDDAPDRHPDWATKRPKGREALRKAYQLWKEAFEGCRSLIDDRRAEGAKSFWPDPTNEQRVQFLEAIGEERLAGYPQLLAWLKK